VASISELIQTSTLAGAFLNLEAIIQIYFLAMILESQLTIGRESSNSLLWHCGQACHKSLSSGFLTLEFCSLRALPDTSGCWGFVSD
jgi:hypothetical protein